MSTRAHLHSQLIEVRERAFRNKTKGVKYRDLALHCRGLIGAGDHKIKKSGCVPMDLVDITVVSTTSSTVCASRRENAV